MPASQTHIHAGTPMGANLIADGATFRVWAPAAAAIYVVRDGIDNYQPNDTDLLVRQLNSEDWAGFFPNVHEFLEDKLWSDNPNRDNLFLWWAGVEGADQHMVDFHHFTQDLIRLRRSQPALRGEGVSVFNVDQTNRVLAFQRWLPGVGRTVVVVVSLSESSFEAGSYQLGFPLSGAWFEVLNSDFYDNLPNPEVRGNGGEVQADGPPRHGFNASAGLTTPANSILVFARDSGN